MDRHRPMAEAHSTTRRNADTHMPDMPQNDAVGIGVAGNGVAGVDLPTEDTPGGECRLGFKCGDRSYYLNMQFGMERRSKERLEVEGQVPVPVAATATLTTASVLFGLFGIFCFLYLLKSMAGINLFSGESPLHPLFALIFD